MLLDLRLIVETKAGNLYYPAITGGQIIKQFPFSCSTANIEIPIDSTVSLAHISPIRCDDVIRVQTCLRADPDESVVYQDCFEGRIMQMSHSDSPNVVTLTCRGHEEEAVYRAVTSDYSAASTGTGAILTALHGSYMDRVTTGANMASGTTLTSYNVDHHSKFMADVIRELEELEGYTYRYSVRPVYSGGMLSSTEALWQEISTTPTTQYQVISGSRRYIRSTWQTKIDSLVNAVNIYGDNSSTQKTGSDSDSTSQSSYNQRDHIETDLSLSTDALCSAMAEAVVDKFKDPLIAGQCVLQLTPAAEPGDLVHCDVQDVYVEGDPVAGDYVVHRVVHNLSDMTTTLEVGALVENVSDMISEFYAKERLHNTQFID
jgi:hypothetical protein